MLVEEPDFAATPLIELWSRMRGADWAILATATGIGCRRKRRHARVLGNDSVIKAGGRDNNLGIPRLAPFLDALNPNSGSRSRVRVCQTMRLSGNSTS